MRVQMAAKNFSSGKLTSAHQVMQLCHRRCSLLIDPDSGSSRRNSKQVRRLMNTNAPNLLSVQWLSGRVLDSRLRGGRFEPQQRHCVVVLEQDTFIQALYWFNPGRPIPV